MPQNPLAPPIDLSAIDTWIFDLDNTLYPARCNLFAQIDQRMGEFIQALLGLDAVSAKALQKKYFREHGTTMRGLMQEHGVDPHEFMEHVHAIDLAPVEPSAALAAALARLPGRKIVFTNGSVAHAERVLARRGIAEAFGGVFDIVASDFRPKPDPEPYRVLCSRYGVTPGRAVMVEDMVRNLIPAHAMGMRTVWVPTAAEWSRDGAELDHVHHIAEDLEAWLIALAEGVAVTP
jgi:putative hydrolase of the HAD superfamily